jgi:hypothetical protein
VPERVQLQVVLPLGLERAQLQVVQPLVPGRAQLQVVQPQGLERAQLLVVQPLGLGPTLIQVPSLRQAQVLAPRSNTSTQAEQQQQPQWPLPVFLHCYP